MPLNYMCFGAVKSKRNNKSPGSDHEREEIEMIIFAIGYFLLIW